MIKASIISKETHLSTTVEDVNGYVLNVASVVKLEVQADQVSKIKLINGDLVIELINGEVITIENFNDGTKNLDNSLVLLNGTTLLHINLPANGDNEVNPQVDYLALSEVDTLLHHNEGESSLLPWMIAGGAVALGGVVAASGGSGDSGADGKDGIDGKDGANGLDGKDGVDGTNGTDGKDGVDGSNGTDGKDGTNGTDGKDGVDGKDGETTIVIKPTPQTAVILQNDENKLAGTAEVGSKVIVQLANGSVYEAVAGNDGSWSIEPNPMTLGEKAVIHVENTEGLESPKYAIPAFENSDKSAPTAPTVNENSQDYLKGTAEAGSKVIISVNGVDSIVDVDATGNWSISPNPIGEGQPAKIVAIDDAGNESDLTLIIGPGLEADTIAPIVPTIIENNKNILSGTGEVGSEVVITVNGNQTKVTVDGSGVWKVQPNPVGEGKLATVYSVDNAGNKSDAFAIAGYETETVPPSMPLITSNSDTVLAGTGEAGTKVIIISGNDKYETIVDSSGNWAFDNNPVVDQTNVVIFAQNDKNITSYPSVFDGKKIQSVTIDFVEGLNFTEMSLLGASGSFLFKAKNSVVQLSDIPEGTKATLVYTLPNGEVKSVVSNSVDGKVQFSIEPTVLYSEDNPYSHLDVHPWYIGKIFDKDFAVERELEYGEYYLGVMGIKPDSKGSLSNVNESWEDSYYLDKVLNTTFYDGIYRGSELKVILEYATGETKTVDITEQSTNTDFQIASATDLINLDLYNFVSDNDYINRLAKSWESSETALIFKTAVGNTMTAIVNGVEVTKTSVNGFVGFFEKDFNSVIKTGDTVNFKVTSLDGNSLSSSVTITSTGNAYQDDIVTYRDHSDTEDGVDSASVSIADTIDLENILNTEDRSDTAQEHNVSSNFENIDVDSLLTQANSQSLLMIELGDESGELSIAYADTSEASVIDNQTTSGPSADFAIPASVYNTNDDLLNQPINLI